MFNGKENYQRKLSHPDWQKKRLKILERDKWECTYCGAKDIELHVHHAYYQSNLLPWEYPDHSLVTLCYKCHKAEEERIIDASATLIMMLKKSGCLSSDFYTISALLGMFDSINIRKNMQIVSRLNLIRTHSADQYEKILELIRVETENKIGSTISGI